MRFIQSNLSYFKEHKEVTQYDNRQTKHNHVPYTYQTDLSKLTLHFHGAFIWNMWSRWLFYVYFSGQVFTLVDKLFITTLLNFKLNLTLEVKVSHLPKKQGPWPSCFSLVVQIWWPQFERVMSYFADKLVIHTQTDTHTHTPTAQRRGQLQCPKAKAGLR